VDPLGDQALSAALKALMHRYQSPTTPQTKRIGHPSPKVPRSRSVDAPPTRKKRTKDTSFKPCLSSGIRHCYQPYIKEISTPEWTATPAPVFSPHPVQFDIREIHRQLEMCESRILNGTDQIHRHPALSVVAVTETDEFPEDERSLRYDTVPIVERIPDFWPERCWDTEERKMNSDESRELMDAMISQRSQNVLTAVSSVKSQSHAKRVANRGRRKKGVPPSVILLNFRNFETESSDCETDLDDF
jgi:hypothetical protein